MNQDLTATIKTARRTGTPLLAIQTADAAATVQTVIKAINGEAYKIAWDIVNGCFPLNPQSAVALITAAGKGGELSGDADPDVIRDILADIALMTGSPIAALQLAEKLPRNSVFIMHMADRLDSHPATQAIWNLRDVFKADGRTLILLGAFFKLPPELQQNVVIVDDPLPSDDALKTIVGSVFESVNASLAEGDKIAMPEDLQPSVTSIRGLSCFAAEQVVAMAISREGLGMDVLWHHKRKMAEQTPGISFHVGGPTFDQIGGQESLIQFGRDLFAGRKPPRLVVQVDEFEKQLAGSDAKGDNGVGRDQLQVILREMVEQQYTGIILVGPPGTGKTIYSEALAATHDVPLIKLDLNATKGSLMGESEKGVREMFRTINACAGVGGAVFVACANRLDENIPPELRRRMGKLGIWFVDLPGEEEREQIWGVHLTKWGLDIFEERPNHTNWTGSDIANCCELAWLLNKPLVEAAKRLVPIAKSNPGAIDEARKAANGRWQSANYPGLYTTEFGASRQAVQDLSQTRTILLEDN